MTEIDRNMASNNKSKKENTPLLPFPLIRDNRGKKNQPQTGKFPKSTRIRILNNNDSNSNKRLQIPPFILRNFSAKIEFDACEIGIIV